MDNHTAQWYRLETVTPDGFPWNGWVYACVHKYAEWLRSPSTVTCYPQTPPDSLRVFNPYPYACPTGREVSRG